MSGDVSAGAVSACPEAALSCLNQVLEEERERGLTLTKELSLLKLKAMELERLISDFGPVWKPAPAVGPYSAAIRQQKVQKYREKRSLRLKKSQVSRSFEGRSQAAKGRVRVKGKFASSANEATMAYTSMAMSLIASQAAENSSEYGRFINTIRSAPRTVCVDVISLIKREIKNKSCPPPVKLRALKLMHACMLTGNNEFLMFASRKVMQRFTIMGRYKRQSLDDNRGADLFGPQSTGSTEHMQASAEFLRCLLSYMKIWAQQFGQGPDGLPSVFLKAYRTLEREGVKFPDSEVKVRRSSQPALSPRNESSSYLEDRSRPSKPPISSLISRKDSESIRTSATLLREMISAGSADKETIDSLAADLRKAVAALETRISTQAALPGANVEALLEANDTAREALDLYDQSKMRSSLSLPSRAKPQKPAVLIDIDSPQAQNTASSRPHTVLNTKNPFLSLRPPSTNTEENPPLSPDSDSSYPFEIAKLQEKVNQQKNEVERIQRKYDVRVSEMEEKYRKLMEEKDEEIRKLREIVENLKEENRRLRGPDSDFLTNRSISSPISSFSSISLSNESDFPSLLPQSQGKLLDSVPIQVGFKLQIQGNEARAMVYIGNKSTNAALQGLITTLIVEKGGNIEGIIDKIEENREIPPRGKADRMIKFKMNGFFREIPALMVKCAVENREIRANVLFPVTILRFLTSPQADLRQIWAIWTSFESFSSKIHYKSLRFPSISVVAEILTANNCFQMVTSREIPEIESNSVLFCGKRETSVCFIRLKSEFQGGICEIRSNNASLQEALSSLLPVLVVEIA